jgi:hypothetical protein
MHKHATGNIPHNNEMIVINEPVDPQTAHKVLVTQRPEDEITRPDETDASGRLRYRSIC